jgi:hypothetical protein
VATEAAGEGINLQFCHLMINYDLPWNPTRLEQRMGRIHRYGQKYEVYIYNLVATSTREGLVLHALLNKLERMREGLGGDRVFDVVDQLLEGVSLEALIRCLDQDQERRLKEATLAGLATRYIDLSRLRTERRQAAEARLVPAYIRAFFSRTMEALAPGRLERRDDGFWRISYAPAALRDVPEDLRRRYGQPAESYSAITFDKDDLAAHPHLSFVGPGHPLFEAVVHHVLDRYSPDLARGTVLRDPAGVADGLLWLLVGSVEDGLGRTAGRRLFALFQPSDNQGIKLVSPARLLDFDQSAQPPPLLQGYRTLLDRSPHVVDWSLDQILDPYLSELQTRRSAETEVVQGYLRRSFDALIARAQSKLMQYEAKAAQAVDMSLRIQEEHRHLDDLRRRQATRLAEAERAARLSLSAPKVIGVAAVLPSPAQPRGQTPMRRSDEVEAAAMAQAIAYEEGRGWQVEDVSAEARGYDLLSTGLVGEIRYVEVKGRAGEGAVELSANEWLKAEQLGEDYWLYIVTDALISPSLHRVQNPARRLSREDVVPQVRYRVAQEGWHRVAESTAEYDVSQGAGDVEDI